MSAESRLTIIKEFRENNRTYCLCRCTCGNDKIIRKDLVVSGRVKSCGCLLREAASQNATQRMKKYNKYDLSGDYGVGYTLKDEEFYFDLEDYDLIKDYCWHINKGGYLISATNEPRKNILMHRLIKNIEDITIPVDHINHNKLDNRKINLRICSQHENNKNTKLNKKNTSGFIGVYWDKKTQKWEAKICVNYKTIHLGKFINKEDALIARLKAEVKYCGDFAPQKELIQKYRESGVNL